MKHYIKSFKLTKVLFTVAFVLICGVLFAQGGPTPESGLDFFSFVINLVPAKYQAVTFTVITALFFLSELLATTTKIKANGTFQLVFGWISSLFKAVSGKKENK